MRLARALTLLLLIVLLAPVTGFVGTASAGVTGEGSELTITGKPKVGVFHDDIGPRTPDVVRHRGVLSTDGAAVSGASIFIEVKLVGGDDWLRFDQPATTDDEGRYTFYSYIISNAQYRAVYEDSIGNPIAVSNLVGLKAMRDFNAELVERPRVAVFKGNINPEWNNKTVEWQRKTCKTCTWRTIDRQRSGDRGGWSFRGDYPPVDKKWFYRATLAGTTQFVKSYSATLITTTTPARLSAARTVTR